jgi:hypothetical protein
LSGYHFDFYDLSILSKIYSDGITGFDVNSEKMSFVVNSNFARQGCSLTLTVRKRKFLGSTLIYSQPLFIPGDGSPTPDGRMAYTLVLRKLGIPALEKGKYDFDLVGSIGVGGVIMNPRDLPNDGELKAHFRLKVGEARSSDIL